MDSSKFLRQQLEQQWQSELPLLGTELQTKPIRQGWIERLIAWGQGAIAVLAPDHSPRIKQIETAAGSRWQVYDPVSDRNQQFTSEMELRAWLEQRYYQN